MNLPFLSFLIIVLISGFGSMSTGAVSIVSETRRLPEKNARRECKDIVSKSPLLRLKRHLFCEYDTTIRPVLQSNATINVTFHLMPKFMDFDDHTNIFTLHTWSSFTWTDDHLKWNTEDFDQVTDIRVKSDEIWLPDFAVYNSGNLDFDQKSIPSTECILDDTGKVFCVPGMKYTTQCVGNYALWPYDKQNCTIRFGSWSHTGEEIDFHFEEKEVTTEHYSPHQTWNVKRFHLTKFVSKYKCCPNDSFPSIILEVNLERHSRMTHAVYITPAVLLLLLTLTVLWLDSRSFERTALACVNFMCHLLVMYDMHWEIPMNGAKVPHIILFYRNSLILASVAMILTTILRKVQATTVAPPKWINSSISVVLSYRAAQFLLIHGKDTIGLIESDGEMEENAEPMQSPKSDLTKEDMNWRRLAVIIEWLSLFVTTLTYIIMLILLIPLKNEFEPAKYGPPI